MSLLRKHLLKLISVLISFGLWLYVINSSPTEVEKIIQLKIVNPKGLSPAKVAPGRLRLRLRGPRAFVKNLYEVDNTVYLNLENSKIKPDQEYSFKIQDKDLNLPFGVRLRGVEPRGFKLVFKKTMTKAIPVEANIVGTLGKNYKLVSHLVIPNKVNVSGPRNLVKKLRNIKTFPIDLNKKKEQESVDISIDQLDNRFKIEKSSVKVSLNIQAKKANLNLNKIPIQFLTTTSRFSTKSRYASLSVLVDESKDIKLSRDKIRVVAEIPEGRGKKSIRLRAILPEGVHLVKIHPETISVRIR